MNACLNGSVDMRLWAHCGGEVFTSGFRIYGGAGKGMKEARILKQEVTACVPNQHTRVDRWVTRAKFLISTNPL